jgi:hypothetical protein
MLNFVQALFKRPPAETDAGTVSRLRQMRQRNVNDASGVATENLDASSKSESKGNSVSGTLSKGPTAVDVTSKIVVGRGRTDQAQEVQQKWLDECGFKRPNTGLKA